MFVFYRARVFGWHTTQLLEVGEDCYISDCVWLVPGTVDDQSGESLYQVYWMSPWESK
jgi:hypothetical protein